MGFYYFSLLSVPLLGVVYGLLLLLFWGVARVTRGMPGRAGLLGVVGAVFLVLPVAEELWIAWNFGQLCKKDAGLFVKKTVEVEGFYDDTTHWWRQLAESKFQFVESRDNTYGGLFRVERDGAGLRHFKIDRPTARYRFFTDSGTDIGHRLLRQESRVQDSETGEAIGEYRVYIRGAPWFYIALDRPNIGCDGPDGGPHSKHKNSFLIYRDVLIPAILNGGRHK
jgi:hypothetical protein